MATTMDGLFGASPYEVEQQQYQKVQDAARQFAQMSPFEKAGMLMYQGGSGLGRMGAEALGGVNVPVQQAQQNQHAMQGADLQTPEGLRELAKKLLTMGNQRGAYLAAQKAQEIESNAAKAALDVRKQDEAEQFRRDQLAETMALKKMQLEQAAESARLRSEDTRYSADQRAQAAREATAARLQLGQLMAQIQQMGIQSREMIAAMSAQSKSSAAEGKAAEKAEKLEEGKAGLEGDITQARNILADLDKSKGITSTQRDALANTFTSLSSSAVGQAVGRTVGSEDQTKRDELKSLRLQLLNSIKQATGMGSAQLNSNVELKTWLDALGSEGMSKQANEAILNNIENKYLKPVTKAPVDKFVVGKRYKDAKGNVATYLGNGQWK